MIPLVDTRIKFGMSKTEVTSLTCILVINIDNDGDKLKFGAMVDNVNEVVNTVIMISLLPTVGKKNKAEFLKEFKIKMTNLYCWLMQTRYFCR